MKLNPLHRGIVAAVVALASLAPMAHAATISWTNSAGGVYSDSANWSGAYSSVKNVQFSLGAAGYTVTVQGIIDQTALTIGNDHVTFRLDDALYGAANSVPLQVGTGTAASTAVLILQSNSSSLVAGPSFFNTTGAVIGADSGARGLVTVDNARGAVFWNNNGNLAIGGATAGGGAGSLLAINAGNTVTTDNTLTLFGGSTLNVNGGTLAMGTFDRRAGSTFIWGTGVVQVTAAPVTVTSTGIFQNGSALAAGQELDALQGLLISPGATMQLNGGVASATTFVNNGTFTFNSGTLAIITDDVSIGVGGIFGSGNNLSAGKALAVTGNTTINAGASLQLNGGTLTTGTLAIQSGGTLAFNSGTLQLTNCDLTIGPGGLLGSNLTLNVGRNLSVALPTSNPPFGVTTINAGGSLLIAGGTFSTAALSIAGGSFGFVSGTLALTNSNATIDAAGLLSTSSTFNAGRNLNVSGATIIAAGGTLALSGGTIQTGGLINNGTLAFTSGTLAITGDILDIGDGGQLGGDYTVNPNMNLEADNALQIDDGHTLSLNGGTITAAQVTLDGSGHIAFNTGTLILTGSTFGVDPAGPLGNNLTLNAGQTVIAPIATTVTGHLTIAGGKLSTGQLPVAASALTFASGEIDLTASTLEVGGAGPLGSNLTLSAGKALSVSDTTTIDGGASMTLSGGSLTTANIVNNGTFNFTAGVLHLTRDPVIIAGAGLFGTSPVIAAGKSLIVDAPLTVQNDQTLTVSGGTVQARILYVGQISGGNVNQSAGSLNVVTNLIVGSISSAAYTLSNTGTLTASKIQLTSVNGTFTQSGGSATTTDLNIGSNVGNSLTISGGTFTTAHTLSDGTILQSGGTLNLGLVDGFGGISLSGNAQATADSVRQASLSLNANATLTLHPSIGADSTSTLLSLGITGSGKLDLANTSMAFYSTSGSMAADYATLLGLVNTGRAGGSWTGNGITSNAAQASYLAHGHSETTALAVVRNDQLAAPMTTFAGVGVDTNTILVKYTYVGDATLDGTLNIDDYLALDRGYLRHLAGWQNGDFNNDGTINAMDYALIDGALLNQGSPLAAGMIAEHTTEFGASYLTALAVPEPASLALLALGAATLLRRRR